MPEKSNIGNILTKTLPVCLIAIFCNLLWGSAFPCIKTGYRLLSIDSSDIPSQILFAGVRFFLAGILALIFVSVAERKFIVPKKNDIGPVIKLSLFQTILQYVLFYIGLANTSGVKASVIEGSNVFVIIIISSLVFKTEKLTFKKIISSLIGFAGIIIINIGGLDFSSSVRLMGEGFVFLSTFAYSFSSGLMKKYSKTHNPVMMSSYQFIFGGLVMASIGLIFGGEIHFSGMKSVMLLLYMAFISSAAYSLWSLLLKYNDISKISVFGFTNPLFGVLLSALFLNEQSEAFGVRGIIALTLVCIGILIVNINPEKQLKGKI